MSDTVLDHVLVRQYLRELDAACAGLPGPQARELHEQLAAHLDEALPADATDEAVRWELGRLGTPRSLAAEATGLDQLTVLRKLGNRARRVRWWAWAAVGLLAPALGTGAGFIVSMNSAAPLSSDGAGWLYPADQEVAVSTSADTSRQTTVPIRPGQRQGILLLVTNDSDWTQVILGPGPNWQPFSDEPLQVAVQTGSFSNNHGWPSTAGGPYASPGTIPPHSTRYVRLTWTSDICWTGSGTQASIDSIRLQVRVGVVTRTETITLVEAFALAGLSQGKCG
jgi:hypothetical protein